MLQVVPYLMLCVRWEFTFDRVGTMSVKDTYFKFDLTTVVHSYVEHMSAICQGVVMSTNDPSKNLLENIQGAGVRMLTTRKVAG